MITTSAVRGSDHIETLKQVQNDEPVSPRVVNQISWDLATIL
jgi:hypothetical protein